ncbi:hypothetical protein [Haladaptatus sp. CMAA 1911]
MAAVDNATEEGIFDAFPSESKRDGELEDCDCDGLDAFCAGSA